ncbi:MAG TPA: peptidoglycan editing factor PgeF [Candidatus Methylomirabilis sp.]|jgi:YfiH family protein
MASAGWRVEDNGGPGVVQAGALAGLAGFAHAFSTRRGGVSRGPYDSLNLGLGVGDEAAAVQENRRRFFGTLGIDPGRAVRVRQVHGEGVLVVDRALAARAGFPRVLLDEDFEYDALVTELPGLALTISTADCLPILIADPQRRAVAAVHAGWRSTVRRIAERAVGALRERYGTDPADCVAALGPGIRGCCYEVDDPVIEPLARALPSWDACVRAAGDGRWSLDLAAANRDMLAAAGLDPGAIHDAGLCTRCRQDLFYSYRGQGARTGRMMNTVLLEG